MGIHQDTASSTNEAWGHHDLHDRWLVSTQLFSVPKETTADASCLIPHRVTAIGIVRFCVLAEQYWEPPKIRFMNTWGPSYSAIETNLAIVTACLPAMLPLLRTWFPRLFGNSSNGGSGPFQQQQQQRRRRWRRYSDEGRRGNESGVMMQGLCHTRAELHGGSKSPTDSREEMLKSPGIRMTTDVSPLPG